jgi:hypothetical protein
MSEQKLNFRDIDYRGLKEGLIEFLRATDTFKDANFEGSFMSQLVNMFSYTGAIFGNYINSMANEQYINTCSLYETGNMLGNLVGYKAHGFSGSRVSVTVTPDFEAMGIQDNIDPYFGWTAVLPKNTRFTTRTTNDRNKALVFTNTGDTIMTIKDPDTADNTDPNVVSLELAQGIPLSIQFTSDGTELQSFEIPNPFVDTKSIEVYVLNDSAEEEKWESVLTWFYSGPESQIYVPYINPKGLLEILFAEGNFGKIPEAGRTIRIEYLATLGSDGQVDANAIDELSDTIFFVNPEDPLDTIQGQFTVTQANESSEGINIETLSRIKKFAPLYFGIQNRLVNNFDYKWFVLGEYPFVVDAAAFNYQEAVEAGLLPSPCKNVVTNPDWADYTLQTITGYDEQKKIPTDWDFRGFYERYTVENGDILPLPDLEGNDVNVGTLLNFGTTSALYADTSRACGDNRGSLISQNVSLVGNTECCTVIHFELEVLNPNQDPDTQQYPAITKDNVELYINGIKCFTRFDSFVFNTEGYVSQECCCDREGDVKGWYVVKGVFLLDETELDTTTGNASVLASIFVKPNNQLLLGNVRVYPDSCFNSNDVFVVPVPENGGYLNVETKETMLEDMDKIKMVTVRNHILAPIYQTFDVRVVFRKDETSIITTEEVTNSIRTEIVNAFLPSNNELGGRLNTVDFNNLINDVPGVARAIVTLTPRSPEVAARVDSLGDYQLLDAEFAILGSIQLG